MAQAKLNFIVTGAARGIGRGLSRLLLEKGHRVFLIDNNANELKHTTDNVLKPFAGSFDSSVTNLRQPTEIKAAVSQASSFFKGHLDVLVNNAAFTALGVGHSKFEDLSLEDWNAQLEVNLTAPMILSQLCLPLLRKGAAGHKDDGGSIIFMSSTRARQSEPDSEGYASTKAGLIGLTHSLSCSLAPMSITVNAILPGWINVANECQEADQKGSTWEDGLSKEDHQWHFSGRVGKVDDILGAVEFVIAQRFVNGQEIVVDGGVSRKMVYPEEE